VGGIYGYIAGGETQQGAKIRVVLVINGHEQRGLTNGLLVAILVYVHKYNTGLEQYLSFDFRIMGCKFFANDFHVVSNGTVAFFALGNVKTKDLAFAYRVPESHIVKSN